MCVSKSDNREIILNDKADEVIEKLLKSFLDKHQSSLGTSNKSSDFVFDCVHLLYSVAYLRGCVGCGRTPLRVLSALFRMLSVLFARYFVLK